MVSRFNLIDEPWIPTVDAGLVSLREVFTENHLRAIGGTPIEKIAITKLLLAIAQSAFTPKDGEEWLALTANGLARYCHDYLEHWYEAFYLYGDKPFLQPPATKAAEIKPFGVIMPDVATGNTTCLTQFHAERIVSDSQKALLLVCQMSLALGGKKTDNQIVLSPGYQGKTKPNGKPTTGKAGPGIAHMGLLHSFAIGSSIHDTLWINLLTHKDINDIALFSEGIGQAPWEQMPKGEDCEIAKALKNSLIGRLIPLSRFCLLSESGIHLTEGIHHLSHKEGIFDPSITVKPVGRELKVVWTDPEHRPWRQLPALLGFISQSKGEGTCFQLKYSLSKAIKVAGSFGVWSGGLRVSSNAGEQYVSGQDDTLESTLFFTAETTQEMWFESYTTQIKALEMLSKTLFGCVSNYLKSMNKDGKEQASKATRMFWQCCGSEAQRLINFCDDPQEMSNLRKRFAGYMLQTYDRHCPSQTARQLDAWAKCRPTPKHYLKSEVL